MAPGGENNRGALARGASVLLRSYRSHFERNFIYILLFKVTPEPICFGFGVCFILAAWSERTLFVIFWILSILLSQFIALCFEGKVFSSNRSLLYPKGNFIILRHLSNMTFLAAILYKLFGPLSDQIQPPLRESELMDICSPYPDTLSAYGVRTYPEIAEGISILKALVSVCFDVRLLRQGYTGRTQRKKQCICTTWRPPFCLPEAGCRRQGTGVFR